MTQVNEHAARKKDKRNMKLRQLPLPGFPEPNEQNGNAWQGVSPERLLNMIVALTSAGAAVILSQSPDAQVTGIMVLHDEHEKRTIWSRAGAETEERLVELEDYFIRFKDGE